MSAVAIFGNAFEIESQTWILDGGNLAPPPVCLTPQKLQYNGDSAVAWGMTILWGYVDHLKLCVCGQSQTVE